MYLVPREEMMVSYTPPTDADLIKEARDFLKTIPVNDRPKGEELEEVIVLKVEATKDHAATLIATGTFPNQAWRWAIREKILGLDPD